jgi:hypothetical protein
VLWPRRSEQLAAARPGGARSAWRRWRDPPTGALATAGLGSLGDADVTGVAISMAVAAVNSAAERSFEEERRRTKVIPRLTSEKATMKLAFATMIRAVERWCQVSVNDIEGPQLRLLRAELGLAPPPTENHATRRRRTTGHRSSMKPESTIYRALRT